MQSHLASVAAKALIVANCAFAAVGRCDEVPTFQQLQDLDSFWASVEVESVNVDLVATVTYWDPRRSKLFVQDGDQALFVGLPRAMESNSLRLTPRDRVHITGTMDKKIGYIAAETISILEGDGKIQPIVIDFAVTNRGEHWSRMVQTEGDLQRVVDSRSHTQLVLKSGTQKLICYVNGDGQGRDYSAMIGARFQVTGVFDWDVNGHGAPQLPICQIMSFDDVSLIAPPETETDSAQVVKKIEDLESIAAGTRVVITGVVTCATTGKNFVLEDSTAGILVECEGRDLFHVGTSFRIHGVFSKAYAGKRLTLECAERLPVIRAATPVIKTTPGRIAEGKMQLRRVAVSGKIVGIKTNGAKREVLMSNSGTNFTAKFTASEQEFADLDLHFGERLGCVGVVFPQRKGEIEPFSISVTSPDSLWIDRGTVSMEKQTAYRWMLGLVTVAVLAAAWLLSMRLQVKRKRKHLVDLTAKINTSYQVIKEGIVVLESDNRIASVNSQFKEITGINLSVGDDCDDLPRRLGQKFHSPEDPEFAERLLGDLPQPLNAELHAHDNPKVRVNAYLAPILDERNVEIGRLLSLQDVTLQKELEVQLIQSQKMEAVGSLAGGIAHDFNNLLMVMGANVQLARSVLDHNDPEFSIVDANLADAETAAERATELVKRLLSFSRHSNLNLEVHSLNDAVLATANLTRRTFRSSIQLTTELDPELSLCKFDRSQIEQVVMNVCLNARDAIEDEEGLITISTANVVTDQGAMVRLRIEDSGRGMSDEEEQRLFEPFFTTKPTGSGTGLGMSTSYGIIVQHGGWIDCVSHLNVGTQINIFLPASGHIETDSTPSVESTSELATQGHTGHALIVDDEPAVRRITAGLMTELGFAVTEAEDGQAALEIANKEPFDLVLLDLNMPGIGGKDVFHSLNSKLPELPVVICTGYLADSASLACEDGRQPAAILKKPFRMTELRDICQHAIGVQSG